jgi:surface antigen
MENNADIIIAYCRANGFNDKTIAGLLANMENESSINPLRQEVGGAGFGLVQWTPVSNLQNACSVLGISPYTDGDVQLQVLLAQLTGNPSSLNEWYTTSANISPYYNSGASSDMIGISASDFISNNMNWSSEKLAIMFMVGYERPSYDPSVNHYQARMQSATSWESYVKKSGFVPRLNELGIRDNFHFYSQNPFYIAGYGMPNCTCYAWGRFWEIGDPQNTGANKPINLPTSDGGQWWTDVVGSGYNIGQTPDLGAVICFSDNNGGSGHVAIVEEIASDGTITCSNSAYQGTFFFLSYITPVNGRYDWSHYTCQGFIYNPYSYRPPIPPTPRI